MRHGGALVAAAFLLGGVTVLAPSPPHADVEARFREADRFRRSGSLARAQGIVEGIEREVRGGENVVLHARALRELARTLEARARSDEAHALLERALGLARAAADASLEGSVRLAQGYAAWSRADYETASRLARDAGERSEAAGDGAGRGAAGVLLGRIAFKRGDYAEGLRLAREVAGARAEAGDARGEADAQQALGEILLDFRSFAAAERAFERRLALVRRLGDREQEVHALNYLGFVSQQGGDLERALSLQQEALRIARGSGDDGALSHALHSIGSVHRDLGRLDDARADYVEAARRREAAGDPRSRAWSLAGLGRVEKERSHARAALEAYGAAVEIFERIGDRRALAWHLLEVARLRAILGDRPAARSAFESTIAQMRSIELPYACLAIAEYGLLLADDGEGGRAVEAGRQARAAADATGNPEMRWSAAHGHGRILRRLGRREEALVSILDAVAIIEGMRVDLLPSDAAKSGFFEKRQVVFEDAAALLVDLGRPERALEIAERARSRAFLDLLGSTERDGTASETEPSADEPSPPTPRTRGRTPGDAERGSGVTSPRPPSAPSASLRSGALVEPPDLDAIRDEARRRDSPILEYFAIGDRVLVWLVTPDGEVRHVAAPIGRESLRRLAEAARSRDGGEGARRELHRRLFEPFEDLLPGDPSRAVLIVPHGPLFLVSFAGLPDARGRYVVERHALAYAPSIGVMRHLRTRAVPPAGASRPVLVIGNPKMPPSRRGDPPLPALPGADEEAEIVRRVWPAGAATVLRGEAARESEVRRLAPASAVIHFATHGVVRADDPMRSYVALSPDPAPRPEGDGFLTVREVFDLRITAGLVVLSACDTGLGRIEADGVMGLGRAFLSAGAGAVVATLWRVADRVALHEMETFHRELRRGVPAAEALRRAQVRTLRELRDGKLKTAAGRTIAASPAYWAAFVVIGN